MSLSPAGIAAALACLAAALSIVLVRRSISRAKDAVTELRERCDSHAGECSDNFDAIGRQIASLEQSAHDSADILREGRLSRSARAQALQVLRSGVSPDTAASSLGLARREVRLLAKVSRVLSDYR